MQFRLLFASVAYSEVVVQNVARAIRDDVVAVTVDANGDREVVETKKENTYTATGSCVDGNEPIFFDKLLFDKQGMKNIFDGVLDAYSWEKDSEPSLDDVLLKCK